MDDIRRPARRTRRPRAATRPHALAAHPDAPSAPDAPLDREVAAGPRGAGGAPIELPVLPVRNAVLLPHMALPLFIDREPALRAVEAAMAHDHKLLIVAQRDEDATDPTADDVYQIGTEC